MRAFSVPAWFVGLYSTFAMAGTPYRVEVDIDSLGACQRAIMISARGDKLPSLPEGLTPEIPGILNRRDLVWHVAGSLEKAEQIASGLKLQTPGLSVRVRKLVWGEALIYIEKEDGTAFSTDEIAALPKPPITSSLPFQRELSLPLFSAYRSVEITMAREPMTPPGRAHFLIAELAGLTGISHMEVADEIARLDITAQVLNSIREIAMAEFFRSMILGAQMPHHADWDGNVNADARRKLADKFDGTFAEAQGCAWAPLNWIWRKKCERRAITSQEDFNKWVDQNSLNPWTKHKIQERYQAFIDQKSEHTAELPIRITVYPGHNVGVMLDITLSSRSTVNSAGRFILLASDFKNVLAFASRVPERIEEPRGNITPMILEEGVEVAESTINFHTIRLHSLALVLQRNYAAQFNQRRDQTPLVDRIDPMWATEAPFSGQPAPSQGASVSTWYWKDPAISGGRIPPSHPSDSEAARGGISFIGYVAQVRPFPRSLDGTIEKLLNEIKAAAKRIAAEAIAQEIYENARAYATQSGDHPLHVTRVLTALLKQVNGTVNSALYGMQHTPHPSQRMGIQSTAIQILREMTASIRDRQSISSKTQSAWDTLHRLVHQFQQQEANTRVISKTAPQVPIHHPPKELPPMMRTRTR